MEASTFSGNFRCARWPYQFPLKRVAVKLVGMKGLAPQGCQILSVDPLLFGLNHMPVEIGTPGRTLTLISDVRSVTLW